MTEVKWRNGSDHAGLHAGDQAFALLADWPFLHPVVAIYNGRDFMPPVAFWLQGVPQPPALNVSGVSGVVG